ncbi:sodium-dependent glucose transporter 1A-like [Tropilaelaps mercedesae]|uniref:Sodium-dependent glucose transporter 1A-like n=1 Tax=Tropilaelaps mercedesae TaxID=418985 RepID=A0A1V9XK56_9ACAR|nr:sodium-dependent glucose transporter 1A-like [Tropilaelaps mercedesae]
MSTQVSVTNTFKGSQIRLVRIWRDQSASALQTFHTSFGVGAMVAPFVAAPFLSVRKEDGSVVEESSLWMPYVLFGGVFALILVSMAGAFFLDPSSIDEEKGKDRIGDTSQKTFEFILVSLLFTYLLIYVNTEVTYSTLLSVYAVRSPLLRFSKSEAAYLSGLFWTTFTGGRVVSIFTAIYFNLKTVMWLSHILLIISSGNDAGTGILGLGLSSLYGAASGHAFDYFVVRHFHLSIILPSSLNAEQHCLDSTKIRRGGGISSGGEGKSAKWEEYVVASRLGVAVSSYVVPPIVDEWPMFLQWYTGAGNVVHFFVLGAMLWVTRGRVKVHKIDKDLPTQTEPKRN